MATAKQSALTLDDVLSRLDYRGARKLLGPKGADLLTAGGRFDIDVARDVRLSGDTLTLRLLAPSEIHVTIALDWRTRHGLRAQCSACHGACVHLGAALSTVLEEKVALGLALPPQQEAVQPLDDQALIERELEAREQRSKEEKMVVRASKPATPWCDYQVSSKQSGKTWRVALRGMQRGESYCSCPDFRKNTLGTCKHILHVQRKVRRKFSDKRLARGHKLRNVIVYLEYATALSLRVAAPDKLPLAPRRAIQSFLHAPVGDCRKLVRAIASCEAAGTAVTVYPDAEEYIQRQLLAARLQREIASIRSDGAEHPLRRELLKTELLPYQLEGVLFAVAAGRAILADDMGLGKTIQGVGTAELLARLADISSVLVVCPASLKGQWRSEIMRFSDRDCQIVVGSAASRAEQYASDAFFTICNYEQVLRDVLPIERRHWDLIILDEGQRIKNWQAKTARVIKSLRSTFALVLSGTPIENRIDELYSVIEFIDDRRLGPGFRFYNHHRVVDEHGKVLGYRNLAELREKLKPILLRRTRASVLKDLPPRQTQIIRITPTQEQEEMHGAHMRTVSSIVGKPYITEMDLLRLQKALLMCRLAADSTELVDKQAPGYSSKLEECEELLVRLAAEPDRKCVLFSEWTSMLDLIQAQLDRHGVGYARLDGSIAQQKRAALVSEFEHNPDCRFFLATNAGSTGLNLQFANTLVNVDLPWNPAVLEQRIGRIHRMGQSRPVQVYLLVTTGTIEENLLATLAAKHELATAALDAGSDIDEVELVSNMEALKRRLEILLGAVPEASVDESQKARTERQAVDIQQREQVALAGGQLLGAAFEFIGQLLPQGPASPHSEQLAQQLARQFEQCTDTDDQGRPRLTVTLPDKSSLDELANSIARLMSAAGKPQ